MVKPTKAMNGLKHPTTVSVTRFCEISPLWQKFTSRWQIFDGLFLIWQNAQPTLANLWHNWDNFHCCKWPKIEIKSNHLVTLITVEKLYDEDLLLAGESLWHWQPHLLKPLMWPTSIRPIHFVILLVYRKFVVLVSYL